MTELKPCPFCGNELISIGWARFNRGYAYGDLKSTYYMVTCKCGASMFIRMKNCDDDEDDLPTEKEAVKIAMERWNRRVIE